MGVLGLASLVLFAAPSAPPRSPWAPAEWRLNLDIGREEGTRMPDDWASSGARLSFSVDVLVESDYAPAEQDRHGEPKFMGPNAMRLAVLEDATFISSEGEQVVSIPEEGAWKLQMPKKKGTSGMLRFWFEAEQDPDLPEGIAAKRNDATLPAERLYFMTKCWRKPDLEIGSRRMRPIELAAKEAQRRLDDKLSHESGDRRLDGTNPLDTLAGSVDMMKLVKVRDDRVQELREAEEKLPRNAASMPLGPWPGSPDDLAIARGTVAVMRRTLLREEFHVIGKWKAVAVEQDAAVVERQ